jgi:two-component system chemotaxis response regulator CheY
MAERILIVDDSPSIRRMMVESLTAAGYDVTACASGAEAVDVAAKQPVKVVISDLNMPDVDGLALTRQLRQVRNTAKCPILILTTESSPARKAEAKQAGANGWILKPFQEETVVRAINSVCQTVGA